MSFSWSHCLYLSLLAGGLCSCGWSFFEESKPQMQLAEHIEKAPSSYLYKRQKVEKISPAQQEMIVKQLETHDKAARLAAVTQQPMEKVQQIEQPILSQPKERIIAEPQVNTNLAALPALRTLTPSIGEVAEPQLHSDWRHTPDQLATAEYSEGGSDSGSPILSVSHLRHPKTPGINTTEEEEASTSDQKMPRPNQPELRGLRAPAIKPVIPLPYEGD